MGTWYVKKRTGEKRMGGGWGEWRDPTVGGNRGRDSGGRWDAENRVNRMGGSEVHGWEFRNWREITPGGLRTAKEVCGRGVAGGERYTGFLHPLGVPSLLL